MKKLRVLASVLVAAFVFNICVFAADSDEYKYFDAVKQKVQGEYRFDSSDADIYQNALKEILKEHPEALDSAISTA